MGVEVAGSELPKVNDEVKGKLFDKENGKIDFSEVITFGSHGVDEVQTTGEANEVSNAGFPKDAVDEWPQERQTHCFYFPKHRLYEDPKVKAELEQIEKEIRKKNERLNQLFEDLKVKNVEKSELYDELNAFKDEGSQYRAFINEKREEMKPLQSALGSLRGSGGEKGYGICSSEEELNQRIRSFEYRMQHETMSLKEEKQLMKEIKELEATRPKVIANSAMRAKIQESMGQKEALQDQVKLLGTDLDGVRKQQAEIKAKKDRLSPQLSTVKKQIEAIKAELDKVKDQKNKALLTVKEIKASQNEANQDFFDNRRVISTANEIAMNRRDVKAVEELYNTEVEKFMSQWNSSKTFRADYEKKLLTSLDRRQLSRDGRIRNFDEKPLVRAESPKPSETAVVSKPSSKPQKEVPKATLKEEKLPEEKAQKDLKKGSKDLKTASERDLEEDVFVVEKPKKDVSNVTAIDAEKLKEMKKEEEKEKQRQAFERKKKMQDKAAAKAALRIQKEAEKKQKEREKKLRKKGASTVQPTDEEEATENPETDEAEKSEDVEAVVETPVPSKAKSQQENVLRHRKPIRTRGTLPKAILKKKKSDKYWLW
uniref:Proton pump-interactor 1 n=2 Tax=Chenopodium quinoa TaxID=63459 RepID=A0A803N250_CHEQI